MLIGIDIEGIKRFERLLAHKPQLLKKLFSDAEYGHALKQTNPAQTLTGIWCAKEAVVKALSQVALLDLRAVQIMHLDSGAPFVRGLLGHHISISIAHTAQYATATAIAFKPNLVA